MSAPSPTLPGNEEDMAGTPHPPPLHAANEALAALERYEVHLRQLVARWLDAELYHTVSQDMQEVRRCCHALPPLSAGWVALLIAHAELVQALWRNEPTAQRQRQLAQVLECVHAVRDRCMRLAGLPARD